MVAGIDVDAVLARRDQVVGDLDDSGQVSWLQSHGVSLIQGHGRLVGERRVRVGRIVYEATRAAVIAVGSVAALPTIDGLADARPWTNREATTARHIPKELIVLGGGAAGVEMADAHASLGSDVVLVEAPGALGPSRGAVCLRTAARSACLPGGSTCALGSVPSASAATTASSKRC